MTTTVETSHDYCSRNDSRFRFEVRQADNDFLKEKNKIRCLCLCYSLCNPFCNSFWEKTFVHNPLRQGMLWLDSQTASWGRHLSLQCFLLHYIILYLTEWCMKICRVVRMEDDTCRRTCKRSSKMNKSSQENMKDDSGEEQHTQWNMPAKKSSRIRKSLIQGNMRWTVSLWWWSRRFSLKYILIKMTLTYHEESGQPHLFPTSKDKV